MASVIQLGDEVRDVVANVRGIVSGHVTYLDGSSMWIIQPPTGADGVRPPESYVPEAYCKRVGDGVRVKPKPPIGFNASKVDQ